MSARMLVNLILLIVSTSGSEHSVWKPKQIAYGAYDDPLNGRLIAWLPGKASLYEIDRELDENKKFFEEHEDKLMLQMHIDHWSKDLEELQKLMQKREYEGIVNLISRAFLVDEESLSNSSWATRSYWSNWATRNYWRRQKVFFWNDGNRTFSEAVLRWILLHAKNELKSEIFLFAAKADLPRFCEEIQGPMSYDVDPENDHTEEECPICKGEMKEDRVITPCHHKFHGKCLSKWGDKHGSCPLCRAELPLQPAFFFIAAIQANSLKCTEIIMKKMKNFNVDVAQLEPPLNALQFVATNINDSGEMCEVLLNNGMQHLIEKPFANGAIAEMTPLLGAIWSTNLNVIKCLLRHGANLQAIVTFPENYGGGQVNLLTFAAVVLEHHKMTNKDKVFERRRKEVYEFLLKYNAENY